MKDYFWSLVIDAEWVQASIWTIEKDDGNPDGATSVKFVSEPIAYGGEADLVSASDSALSSIARQLPEDAKEPTKTVFGVNPAWVESGQIVREHLDDIRLLCSKLSLNPVGFVVLPEAIAHFASQEEGAPLSGVIIGVGETALDVSVFRLGNLTGTVNVARSSSISDDLVEGLTRFGPGEPFPSRFLLYDSRISNLEEAKQELIQFDWMQQEKIKFLHTPQVDVVTPRDKMVAVSFAGAFEMAGVKNVIFAKKAHDEAEGSLPQEYGHDNLVASDMGFVEGADVAASSVGSRIPTLPKFKKPSFAINRNVKLPGINLLDRFNMNEDDKLAMALIAILSLFLVLVAAWWFLPKSNIAITLAAKKLEFKQKIAFDTSTSRKLTTSVSGDKTRSATGSKTIGQSAKGQADIENGTASDITIPANTQLVTSSGLKFTTNTSLTVPAAASPHSPGIANVAVTAVGYGSDYNLAKGETFTVASYSKLEVDGVASVDFSGGSSSEVVAVSKDDLKALSDSLTSDLTAKAKQDLTTQVTDDEVLVDSSVVATPSSVVFDHSAGDEASSVKLTEKVSVSGMAIPKKALLDMVRKLSANSIPAGYVFDENSVSFVFSKGEVDFVVSLLPKIDETKLAKQIAGFKPSSVQGLLSSLPGFVSAEINTTPTLPGFLGTLPHNPGSIHISVESQTEQ